MKKHWQYLKYVLRHKWFVFLACLEYGLIWRGIKHDWTKFLPSEWFPYVNYFYGEKQSSPNKWEFRDGKLARAKEVPNPVQDAFDRAWLFHQKRNSHHWQFWLLSPDNPRPNFTWQGYGDPPVYPTFFADVRTGEKVALVDESSIVEWFKPSYPTIKRMIADLDNTPVPLKMSASGAKEMIADWRGAGKALGKPNTWQWYQANKDRIFLHPETREWVEAELERLKKRDEDAPKRRERQIWRNRAVTD